ncbi:MAG: acyl carrier protein [Stackebrandtia sp.]
MTTAHQLDPVPAGEQDALPADLDAVIGRYATWTFDDDTSLVQAGLDSLSVLRMVADLAPDPDREIGAERLVAIETVRELKTWLTDLCRPDGAGEAGGE